MEPSAELRQAKNELKSIVSGILEENYNGIGLGTLVNTTPGAGREVSTNLSLIPGVSSDFGFRVYMRNEPSSRVSLPESYRGVHIGYVVSGKICAAEF